MVSEEPKRYAGHAGLPAGTTVHHRDRLDAVQRDLAKVAGVSVLIYDQTCAAEKRRRRKRGTEPAPSQRVLINELVCEGCGDCGVQSNCVAIQPLETEFGRKRVIDQSACNQDFSCLKGFCPSFVTVHGAVPKASVPAPEDDALPDPPALPALNGAFAILLAGIGGTGVVTIGRVLAMAAHLEGKAAAVVDVTGLAQKGGPVTSHVRIASRPEAIKAVRIAAGGADLLIGGDAVVAGSASALAAIDPGHTAVFVNSHETYSGAFTHDPDYTLPMRRIVQAITNRAGAPKCHFIEASEIATALMGDAIATNMFLLGLAWQAGAVPLSHFAILKAIALNGVDVAMNQAAFAWGRRAAAEPEVIVALAAERSGRRKPPAAESLDEMTARRTRFLTEYQDERYAQLYADAVAAMHEAETRVAPGRADLSQAVARNLYRLMAVKDVYEVARLYTDGSFDRQLGNAFAGWDRLEYHLVPPLFAGRDKASGHRRQRTYGPGISAGPQVHRAPSPAARLMARPLRPYQGATHGAAAHRRLRGDAHHDPRPSRAGKPSPCRGACPLSGENPWLRPRQGGGGGARAHPGGGPARGVSCRRHGGRGGRINRRQTDGRRLSENCTRIALNDAREAGPAGTPFDEEVRLCA